MSFEINTSTTSSGAGMHLFLLDSLALDNVSHQLTGPVTSLLRHNALMRMIEAAHGIGPKKGCHD